ncbi:phosphohydrolase [Bacillaceae bacterium JMAK1]|nr:phosphohydrolase [Bacillaceae bacterium JMAK1]
MRNVTLMDIYTHPVARKFITRSGLRHAIDTANTAYNLAAEMDVDPDLATKAAFMHDIGHYTWYREDGKWDFDRYKENDIHAIKGAERAHKLLIRLGEDRSKAKEIALAILLHTDSYLPEGTLALNPLQQIVAKADELNEQPNGSHHYMTINEKEASDVLTQLDQKVEEYEAVGHKKTS